MSEIERYNGLTTADKPALLDAKANGFKVFCETSNGKRVFYSKYPSASEANSRIVSIDLALAQIAEMETAQAHTLPPMTWNERINQMTVLEKVLMLNDLGLCLVGKDTPISNCKREDACSACLTEWLNSPYTEGETV